MPKYIDVGAINWYDDLFMKGVNNSGVWVRYKDVESLIRNAPAADVEPVRHGRWVPINRINPAWSQFGIAQNKCSVCGSEEVIARKRCPECGAKMGVEDDGIL